ncbi:helix-turn-helix transcriptional regulator [Caballeronia sp. dw_276]|jgi:transcriptional regulator with XRE-family HTH domain|uniref:helix-turn-helix domain-containing protein n=1 Tax=Caballeronia sp. dw_276 TaxID=2719795 RepID=UPI001BD33784|nr:helix-turn-helix transcriptional regulator [Caballeronia sp. dw_276]
MTRKKPDLISNTERVAAELRALRRELRMNQQALADRAGVSRRTITNAETAQNVGLHEFCRMANALGYNLTLRPKDTVVYEDLDFFFREEE